MVGTSLNIKHPANFTLTSRLRSSSAFPSMPSINIFSRVAILSINSQDSAFNPVALKEGVPLRINKSDGNGGSGRCVVMGAMVTSKCPS